MKLLLDEMWSPDIAAQIRTRGFDVEAVAERVDLRSQPDHFIFAVAQREARVIVTENVPDFCYLAEDQQQQGQRHIGLVFTSDRRFPRRHPRTAGRLVSALIALLMKQLDLTDREYWLS